MTTPNVTEIQSARTLTFPLGCGRSITVPCAGPYIAEVSAHTDGDYGGQTHADAIHGYRERAEQLRALDAQQCAEHGDSVIYCGCAS